MIRIKAECPKFSINEDVKEKKAEARLRAIKKLFEKHGAGKLTVSTAVVNPQLF